MTTKIPTQLSEALGRIAARDDLARFAIDGVEPLAVVSPSSEDALREVVAAADGAGVAVFPRGGGTRTALGSVPSRAGAVVDMSRLNRVVAHNAGDMTAAFQAGASMSLVSEVLAQQGQMLALDAPLPARATVGGSLATGIGGPLKWHLGHPRDTVIGMRVVQPDGAATKSGGRVVKNVSGYDMARLHVGGLGSLGIIVEAAFKLTPIPMYEDTLLASFGGGEEEDSRQTATGAAMGVFNSHVMPLALTAMDAGAARRAGADAARGDTLLAIRLGGRHRTLERQVDDSARVCRDAGARRVERLGGGARRLWRALSDFGWEDGESAPALAMRISAMPNRTREAAAAVLDANGVGRIQPRAAWHPGFGAVDGAWDVADGDDDPPSVEELAVIVAQARRSVAKVGGRSVVTRCPTALKREIDVWDGEPPGFGVMRQMKAVYDPNGTMNPGRYVGGL